MSYEPVTIREAAQLEVLLFVGLAFVGSLLIIYWGLQTYRFSRVIRDTPPEPVRSVAMGRTEVQGQIVPSERVFDQPFTEGQCVYGEYKVREYRENSNDDDEDPEWKTIEKGSFGTPFYIDDGTGEILVEPTEETLYEISDENSTKIKVGKGDTPPQPVQEFLGSGGGGGTGSSDDDDGGGFSGFIHSLKSRFSGGEDEGDDLALGDEPTDMEWDGEQPATDSQGEGVADGGAEASRAEGDAEESYEHVPRHEIGSSSGTRRKRRYIQKVLPVDGETYVFGGATRRNPANVSEGDVDEAIRADPSTDEFIISDADEFDLAKRYSRRSVLYMVSGLLASAMILALLAQILVTGPVYGIEAALPWVMLW